MRTTTSSRQRGWSASAPRRERWRRSRRSWRKGRSARSGVRRMLAADRVAAPASLQREERSLSGALARIHRRLVDRNRSVSPPSAARGIERRHQICHSVTSTCARDHSHTVPWRRRRRYSFSMITKRTVLVLGAVLCTPIRRGTLGSVGLLPNGGSSDGNASPPTSAKTPPSAPAC